MNMNCFSVHYDSAYRGVPIDAGRPRHRYCSEIRNIFDSFPINTANDSVRRLAKSCGVFRDRIQNRLDIRRRAGDNSQDLACRGLLLQRFGELAISILQLSEQPNVLDRDHRLICEGFYQGDLAVRKLPRLRTVTYRD